MLRFLLCACLLPALFGSCRRDSAAGRLEARWEGRRIEWSLSLPRGALGEGVTKLRYWVLLGDADLNRIDPGQGGEVVVGGASSASFSGHLEVAGDRSLPPLHELLVVVIPDSCGQGLVLRTALLPKP